MAINKNKLIASAQRLTQRGQLDRAIREYRTIVEHDPDDVRVWMKIGALYVRKGATQHAVATYNRVAAYYQENGHHQKAAAVYKQIIGLVPGAIDAHLSLADVLTRLGQSAEAVNELQIVVGSYEREGRHRDSCELLARIVELAPDEEANRIRLAEAFARQNDTAGATREFKTVLDQLYNNRRLDDFIQVAERLLYLAPDEIDTVRRLAEVYLQRHQPKRALARLQVLFQSDPSDTDVLEMLGQAFNDLGYRGKAISVYRELARIQGARGNDSARLDALRSLLAIDPKDPEALEATGAREMLSAPPGGRRIDVSAPPRHDEPVYDGDHAERFIEDAQLYLKYSLHDHAMARIERVLATSPQDIDALALKAELLGILDQPGEAVQIYTRLADLTTGDQAMVFLGKVIELRPDDLDARARLRRLSGDMASARGKVISLSPPAAESVEGFEVELNLDGMEFDDGLGDGLDGFVAPPATEAEGTFDFELDLDALDPLPDDDAFSDLLGGEAPAASIDKPSDISRRAFGDLSRDDEFGDLLEPDASTSLGASDFEEDFGDLLGGDFSAGAAEPVPDDDAFGDLLADADADADVDLDDGFGDLLAPAAGGRRDSGALLIASPAAAAEDDFGDLLAPAPRAPVAEVGASPALISGVAPGAIVPPPPSATLTDDMDGSLAVDASDAQRDASQSDSLLGDDSFGDLLADLGYDGPDDDAEVSETAEVLADEAPAQPNEDQGDDLGDALAAAVAQEARRERGLVGMSDVDFTALPPSNAPPPAGFDLSSPHLSSIAPAAQDAPQHEAANTVEINLDDDDDDIDFDAMFDDSPLSPIDDEGVGLLEEDGADAAPEDFDSEVVVASLPGVVDTVTSSIDLVDDDDIIELDDDEFEVEEISEPPAKPVAPSSGVRSPGSSAEPLRDRLARLAAPKSKRPAPPPIPGGGLFQMPAASPSPAGSAEGAHDVADAPEADAQPGAGSLAGSEFFNISADVEWAELAQGLPRLDALLAKNDVKGARALLSELNQEHPGHPALSERLDRILSLESGPSERAQSDSLPPPLPITGVRSADVSAPPASMRPVSVSDVVSNVDLLPAAPRSSSAADERGLLSSMEVQSTFSDLESVAPSDQTSDDVDFGTIQGSTISELDEDDAMSHFDLGVAFKEMGQYKKSIEQLALARQNSDLYAEATRVLASAHHERGESEVAVDLLREAIGDARVIPAAQMGLRYELAGVFETIGRHADAAVELQAIAQQAPGDFPDVAARLARLSNA